jgi:hypothetical protein
VRDEDLELVYQEARRRTLSALTRLEADVAELKARTAPGDAAALEGIAGMETEIEQIRAALDRELPVRLPPRD